MSKLLPFTFTSAGTFKQNSVFQRRKADKQVSKDLLFSFFSFQVNYAFKNWENQWLVWLCVLIAKLTSFAPKCSLVLGDPSASLTLFLSLNKVKKRRKLWTEAVLIELKERSEVNEMLIWHLVTAPSLSVCLDGEMKGKSKQWQAEISHNHLMLEWVEPSLPSSSE